MLLPKNSASWLLFKAEWANTWTLLRILKLFGFLDVICQNNGSNEEKQYAKPEEK